MSTKGITAPEETMPDGVQTGLMRYGLGEKLRQLRHERHLRLVEIAASSGLSPSLISKLESNKLFPTLPTLWRLAEAFNVGLDYFFTGPMGPAEPIVIRAAERATPANTNGKGYLNVGLLGGTGNSQFNVSTSEIVPSATVTAQHAGCEFVYVMAGELEMYVDQKPFRLGVGDSLYFQSGAPHTYRNLGGQNCRLLLVVSTTPQAGL